VVNSDCLGCLSRPGSRVRRKGNGSGNQTWWRDVGSRWLLEGPSNTELWRRGGGSTAGSGGCFNVSVTGVEGSREEGKRRGELLPEGEEEEASSPRW
jgi:hypothetical protein